jgi:hypothetical protein
MCRRNQQQKPSLKMFKAYHFSAIQIPTQVPKAISYMQIIQGTSNRVANSMKDLKGAKA